MRSIPRRAVGRPRVSLAPLLVLAAWLVPAPGRSQVDIESLRGDDIPPGLSGSVTGDLAWETGNTKFVDLGLSGRLNVLEGASHTLLVGEGGVGFLRGDRFASAGLLHFRETYRLSDRVATEAFGQLDYDRNILLDFRALAGAGLRVEFSRGRWGALGVGSSLMWEHERLGLAPDDDHPDRTDMLRNSTFLTLRLVGGESLIVTSTGYVQPSLTAGPDDFRIIQSTRLAATLTEQLALTVTFNLRYDRDPPKGVAELDTRLRTGLSFIY